MALGLGSCACEPFTGGLLFACADDGDCAEGFVCRAARCTADPGEDAGASMDAGVDGGGASELDGGGDAGADAGDALDAGPRTLTLHPPFFSLPDASVTCRTVEVSSDAGLPASVNLAWLPPGAFEYFADEVCGVPAEGNLLTQAPGDSRRVFSFLPVGSPESRVYDLVAFADGYGLARAEVEWNVARKLLFSGVPGTAPVGGCVALSLRRQRGNLDFSGPAEVVTLSASVPGAFFGDAGCAGAASTELVFAPGQASKQLFFKPQTPGPVVLRAEALSYAGAAAAISGLPMVRRFQCNVPRFTALQADGGFPPTVTSRACAFSPPVASLGDSFVVLQTVSSMEDPVANMSAVSPRCTLTGTGTVTCYRSSDRAALDLTLQVVEVPGVVVRTGTAGCTAGSLTLDAGVGEPLVLKASTSAQADLNRSYLHTVQPADAGRFDLIPQTGCANFTAQALYWPGVTVESHRIDAGVPTNVAVRSFVGLTPIAEPRLLTLVQVGGTVGMTYTPASGLFRANPWADDAVGLSRNLGDAGVLPALPELFFQRADFGARGTVELAAFDLEAGELTATRPVGPVDPSRTVLLSTHQSLGGQGVGESADTLDDVTTALFAFSVNDAGTQLTVTRGSAAARAKVMVQLLELVP